MQITTIVPVGSLTQEYIPSCSVVNSDHEGIFACGFETFDENINRYKFIRYMKNFDETAFVNGLNFLFCWVYGLFG